MHSTQNMRLTDLAEYKIKIHRYRYYIHRSQFTVLITKSSKTMSSRMQGISSVQVCTSENSTFFPARTHPKLIPVHRNVLFNVV